MHFIDHRSQITSWLTHQLTNWLTGYITISSILNHCIYSWSLILVSCSLYLVCCISIQLFSMHLEYCVKGVNDKYSIITLLGLSVCVCVLLHGTFIENICWLSLSIYPLSCSHLNVPCSICLHLLALLLWYSPAYFYLLLFTQLHSMVSFKTNWTATHQLSCGGALLLVLLHPAW